MVWFIFYQCSFLFISNPANKNSNSKIETLEKDVKLFKLNNKDTGTTCRHFIPPENTRKNFKGYEISTRRSGVFLVN